MSWRPCKFLMSAVLLALLVISGMLIAPMMSGTGGDDTIMVRDGPISDRTRGALETEWPVYMGDLNHTGASDARLPKENDTSALWVTDIPSLLPTDSPIVYGGVLYIGSGDGRVRGLDLETGEVIWNVYAASYPIPSAVTAHDGVLYFGADNGHLYGFDISGGQKVLDLNLNAQSIVSSPVVADGKIFVGTIGNSLKNHRFVAIDIPSGSLNWSLSMGDTENFFGFKETAAYWDGMVFTNDGFGNFYCLDADGFEDGNNGSYLIETDPTPGNADILWAFNATYPVTGDPMLAEGKVYFGNYAGRLFCLDAVTGAHIWNRTIGKGEQSLRSCPSYHEGVVYVTTRNTVGMNDGGTLHALNADTGTHVWRFNTTGIITESSPVHADGALVFAGRDSKVYCIDDTPENIADEDRKLWAINTGSPFTSTPAVAMGRVFVARNDPSGSTGKVFAIGSPDPEVIGLTISDRSPYVGERVSLNALIMNNATVGATVSVQFKVSNANNSYQKTLGSVDGFVLEAFDQEEVSLAWTVEPGFEYLVVFITDVSPKDKDLLNNFGSTEVVANTLLKGYWLSSGAGPGRTANGGERLESNRTYWSYDIGSSFTGSPEGIFYEASSGNGALTATGATLFFATPEGDLVALNNTPDIGGQPGLLWKYSDSSVDMIGRPALMIEQSQVWGGPNKVFVMGSDEALYAFDWIGFWDDNDDGPIISAGPYDTTEGDLIWRTAGVGTASIPMFISGGNVIVATDDGKLSAYDDDSGAVQWSVPFQSAPLAADETSIFATNGANISRIVPVNGSTVWTMDLGSRILDDRLSSLSYINGMLLATSENMMAVFDASPDENGDGNIDGSDIDDGVDDNGSGCDTLWYMDLPSTPASPPALSTRDSVLCAVLTDSIFFLNLMNGTEITHIQQTEAISGRAVCGGDSFYIMTRASPWTLTAYSPRTSGGYEKTWKYDLDSMPRGEGVLSGDHLYISTADGVVVAIGSPNSQPHAIIGSPSEGVLLFPDEVVELDASSSFDPDGDPLTYSWWIAGSDAPLYEGSEPVVSLTIPGIGKQMLVLRVYDDMRAWTEARTNVTLLKRVTYDFEDFYYGVKVHMSYGISEPSGIGLVNLNVTDGGPVSQGAVFICRLEFIPWPRFAQYRFEWANVTIVWNDKEFPVEMNVNKLRIFRYEGTRGEWTMAPDSGVDLEAGTAYGNFTDLAAGYYAIGILDNSVPELRHRESPEYIYKMTDGSGYRFRLEYRDVDEDRPVSLELVIDNSTTVDLVDESFGGSVSRFTFFGVSSVDLAPGWHTYYFEADDGSFIIRSPFYSLTVPNSPPVPVIQGPTSTVYVGDHILFDGSGSTDPDGDELAYSWDFDDRDGIQREGVASRLDHVYYTRGIYIVTLTVSDGTDERLKTLTVSVIEEDEDPAPTPRIWLIGLIVVFAVLIIGLVLFILLSRKGREPQREPAIGREGEWSCPECGTQVPQGVSECAECGYEYDPLDFDDKEQ